MQIGPGEARLRKYIGEGLTQVQMVDAWEKESGVRVSRSAIAMAIARYGLESSHPRPRYDDLLPWKVSVEHLMANDARMLRLAARRRRGEELSDDEMRWLDGWRKRLDEANAVVTYDPGTLEGFHWTHRKKGDDDLIRRPPVRKKG